MLVLVLFGEFLKTILSVKLYGGKVSLDADLYLFADFLKLTLHLLLIFGAHLGRDGIYALHLLDETLGILACQNRCFSNRSCHNNNVFSLFSTAKIIKNNQQPN